MSRRKSLMEPELEHKIPFLIITCGLTGTGKSTIIKDVAMQKDIIILASDYIRKKLAGISPEEHRYEDFDKGIYSKEFTEETYLAMIKEGKNHLKGGKSVVLDACFPKKWQRQKAFETARETNADFICIEFICPEANVKSRLAKRFDSKKGISNGRWEIYVSQKESFEGVDEFSSKHHLIIDTSEPVKASVKKIIERLDS
jgi:predicted kinase